MKCPGFAVVIFCCLLIHFSPLVVTRVILFHHLKSSIRVVIYCIQGLTFLAYPFLGHLADVYLTRYRALKWSAILLSAGGLFLGLLAAANVAVVFALNSNLLAHKPYIIIVGFAIIIAALIYFVGRGLFQANAIQFGLDQLLESPTETLVAFIHWYYWSQEFGYLVLCYTQLGIFALFPDVKPDTDYQLAGVAGLVATALATLTNGTTLILLYCYKKHLYIQTVGLNPFNKIYGVLKYSWKHTFPENRSAFTYWENDIPPRIDLGKEKYGGPFTTEEVEDTKTLLTILPLLLSLLGFHLLGDGYSASEQLQRTSCPSMQVLLLVVINPQHLNALVIVVGIPLYRLVIRKVFPCFRRVLMLTRMWVGLYLSLVQVILYIVIVVNHSPDQWQHHHSIASRASPTSNCYYIRLGIERNHTWKVFTDPIDNIYLFFTIPQFLNGLSSLLVFMTALEFICAQAPRTTQGLLIGVWYASFSIRYLLINILDIYITERRSWLIYEGSKGFLILVSLTIFSCVSRYYQYRQRDEIVNEQGMIEEIFERRLDQEEAYMQECRALRLAK